MLDTFPAHVLMLSYGNSVIQSIERCRLSEHRVPELRSELNVREFPSERRRAFASKSIILPWTVTSALILIAQRGSRTRQSKLTHVAPYREANAGSRGRRFRSTSVILQPEPASHSVQKDHQNLSSCEVAQAPVQCSLAMFSLLSSQWLSTLTLLSTLGSCYAVSILTPSNSTQRRGSNSYIQAAYFTNWYRLSVTSSSSLTSLSHRKGYICCQLSCVSDEPTDIDPSQLTHLLYAFADVSANTGEVFLTDSWADEESCCLLAVGHIPRTATSRSSPDSNLRGNFVASAVHLIKDYGFDGIDVDFEYPANEAEGRGFLELMTSLRDAFDDLATANGDTTPYELTAAVSAGSQNYAYYPVPQLDRVLTYWNLMAYDYAGSWLTFADNQANLYGGSRTGVSTDAAVKHYISSGATPRKLAMGIPLYGRAFENTNGIGQSYSGIGPGTLQAGVYSYKDLPIPGARVFEDLEDVTSYSYDPIKRELVSYDIPDIVRIKAEYIMSKSLAGCMFWELSTDKTGSDSLVQTAGVTLGQLDQTPNHIHYPNSKWDNIRDNMGSGSTTAPSPTSTATLPRPTTTTTSIHAPTSTSTTSPNSCLCGDVSPWSATTSESLSNMSGISEPPDQVVYTGDEEAVYGEDVSGLVRPSRGSFFFFEKFTLFQTGSFGQQSGGRRTTSLVVQVNGLCVDRME
ncbi:glycoside hydrolase superfamily [Butyriboletus roseoflavus]|nr:glycoside hydrolase superfamily [Butyriboletus roseoflavus]